MESTTDTFVAIIGSGIIGRIAARKFSELKIPNILISPASEIVYKVKHLDGGFPSKKIYIPSLGHSSMWGNQHDINFADFWQPPAFSDLPGFPLQPGDIFDEIQDLNRYLGVSITAKSVKSSSFEQSLGVQRFHLKGQRSILKRRFPLENFNHVEFEVDSIHIRINSEKGAQITYTNLDGDEKTVHSRYLVLSAGGLGNLEIMDRLYRDNKMEIPKTLGMGYVNHPKAITHYLKLRRYSRVNIQSTSLFKSWSKFQVFDMQLDSSDVRQPRISVRFWEMPIAEFSQSIGTTTKVLEKILDSILPKMGWHRYLKVMVYFESAQLTTSYLNVQSRGQEVKISQKIGNFECLTRYYSEAISELSKKFERNPLIDKTCSLELDFINLPYHDSHHYMSTTRMSTDVDSGVVDKWGQVHGIPRVFCIGTSVLSVSAVNHPTYIAAALSIRTVKRIAQFFTDRKG